MVAGALLLTLAGTVASAPVIDTTGLAARDTTDLTASVILAPPGQHETMPALAHPFRPGESLKFAVRYGFVHAGTAWLEVPARREWNGHEVYELVARAESNRFFSAFYKVRNRIESYWDSDGHFTRRYTEDRREGGFRFKGEIRFDHDRREAVYEDGRSFPIPPRVQDALSSFYYTRTQALPIGGSIVFDYHASHKSLPLQVRIIGRERVQTPAGTFDCVAIEPTLKAGGIFKNNGRLVIWLTDDDRRMPVLMRSKLSIGSITVELTDVRTGTG